MDAAVEPILRVLAEVFARDRTQAHGRAILPSAIERAQQQYLDATERFQLESLAQQRQGLDQQASLALKRESHEKAMATARTEAERSFALDQNAVAHWPIGSVSPSVALSVSRHCKQLKLNVFATLTVGMSFAERPDIQAMLMAFDNSAHRLIRACGTVPSGHVSPALYFDFNRNRSPGAGHGIAHSVWHVMRSEPCLLLECGTRNGSFSIDAWFWHGSARDGEDQRSLPQLRQSEFPIPSMSPDEVRTSCESILSLYIAVHVDRFQASTSAADPITSLTWELLSAPGPWRHHSAIADLGIAELQRNGEELALVSRELGFTYLCRLAEALSGANYETGCRKALSSCLQILGWCESHFLNDSVAFQRECIDYVLSRPPDHNLTERFVNVLVRIGWVEPELTAHIRARSGTASSLHSVSELIKCYFEVKPIGDGDVR